MKRVNIKPAQHVYRFYKNRLYRSTALSCLEDGTKIEYSKPMEITEITCVKCNINWHTDLEDANGYSEILRTCPECGNSDIYEFKGE